MSFLTDIENDINTVWGDIENIGEEVGTALYGLGKTLLVMIAPQQLAILWDVVLTEVQSGGNMTTVLNKLESDELAWWGSVKAEIQTDVLNALSSLAAVTIATAAPAAPAPAGAVVAPPAAVS